MVPLVGKEDSKMEKEFEWRVGWFKYFLHFLLNSLGYIRMQKKMKLLYAS
jgi:hypothetical protein